MNTHTRAYCRSNTSKQPTTTKAKMRVHVGGKLEEEEEEELLLLEAGVVAPSCSWW
jgi:hypothetical protein